MHTFTLHGHRWLNEPDNPNSTLTDNQTLGLAEYFNYEIIGGHLVHVGDSGPALKDKTEVHLWNGGPRHREQGRRRAGRLPVCGHSGRGHRALAAIGGGTVAVGVIMAADPVGSVLGAFVFSRWIPEHAQVKAIGTLGIIAGIPLAVCVVQPGLLAFMGLIAVSGAYATAYNIRAPALVVRGLPEARRAQGSELLSSGLITVQGSGP